MRRVLALVIAVVMLGAAAVAQAAPEAHLLRVDPRASQSDGQPIITTLIELVQSKRMSDITARCAALEGNDNLDCLADALEQPQALYAPIKLVEDQAVLSFKIEGSEHPAKLVSAKRWADAKKEPGIGTAWLVLLDAASTMGPRTEDAKRVARALVEAMGPNDIVDVMVFDSRAVIADSKWVARPETALNFIDGVRTSAQKQGRSRPLFNIIKQAAADGLRDLGNVGSGVKVPLHQALVVVSNGSGGTDPGSTSAGALGLKEFLTKGRFPEGNQTVPKLPMPVVSVWLPIKESEEIARNAREFMENLANPEIGGHYAIVPAGGGARGKRIAQAVRQRFDEMHVLRWRVACVAPSVNQSVSLGFPRANPAIAGDNFLDVPIGIDPQIWPLDIDYEKTRAAADKSQLVPGGKVSVFGNFCWSSQKERAQLYLLPPAQGLPEKSEGLSIDDAKKLQAQLVQLDLVATADRADESSVDFVLPDSEAFVPKSGAKVVRVVVFDGGARRTSAFTEAAVLKLPCAGKGLPLIYIAVGVLGGVVLLLLGAVVVRSSRSRPRAAAPAPVAARVAPPMPQVLPPQPAAQAPAVHAPAPAVPVEQPRMPSIPPPAALPQQARLEGMPGIYAVPVGRETRVGRDPGMTEICLTEPRISGLHATLKLDGGVLSVRDEGSNNGTFVGNNRLAPHIWNSVPAGASIKFGPIEFAVRLE